MQYINRADQQAIALSFEKDFSRLVRQVNSGKLPLKHALIKTYVLAKEIDSINRPHYFEEDGCRYLSDLVESMAEYAATYLAHSTAASTPPMLARMPYGNRAAA